jgi:preprotein translocase subunit SecG
METVILVIHILLAISIVGVVLLQRSEGGGLGMGSGGGSGAGGGLISTRAASDLLTRMTAILAGCFMLTSIALSIMASNRSDGLSVLDETVVEEAMPDIMAEPEQPSVPLSE